MPPFDVPTNVPSRELSPADLQAPPVPRRRFVLGTLAAPAVLASAGVWAQAAFPNRPVKLLVAFPAGGPTDVTMRILADNASRHLGQPVVVENRAGAAGTLPAVALQTTPADGYTVAQIPVGVFRLPMTTKLTWDPLKDLTYILNATGYAFGVVVPTDGPIKSWADLVAWAKANPGRLTYGSTGALTSLHLGMEAIAQQLGVQFNHVPYRGSADLMQAILGGHIMAAADSTGFASHVQSGKLRVLNTWGDARLPTFPDAPTLRELGINMVINTPFGIAAPRGTPADVVVRLHDAFKRAMEEPSYTQALARFDMSPTYMDGARYLRFAQEFTEREKALLDRLGLTRPS